MQAVVQTFHVDRRHMDELVAALDEAAERFSLGFGGLICLERDGLRQEVTVIVMWEDVAMEAFAREVAEAHRHIAATTDLGVLSRTHQVRRYVPGVDLGALLAGP